MDPSSDPIRRDTISIETSLSKTSSSETSSSQTSSSYAGSSETSSNDTSSSDTSSDDSGFILMAWEVMRIAIEEAQQRDKATVAVAHLACHNDEDDKDRPQPKRPRIVQPRPDYTSSGWANLLRDPTLMDHSSETAKMFIRRFRVPYPFFLELVRLVKRERWFPTALTDVAGRPCIPVELKVSITTSRYGWKGHCSWYRSDATVGVAAYQPRNMYSLESLPWVEGNPRHTDCGPGRTQILPCEDIASRLVHEHCSYLVMAWVRNVWKRRGSRSELERPRNGFEHPRSYINNHDESERQESIAVISMSLST